MSEQWTWEPLPDNAAPIEIEIEYYVEEAGDDAVVYSAAYPTDTGLTMHDQVRTTISWSQHDDLRLCRRVPAQGVPVEVRQAITKLAAQSTVPADAGDAMMDDNLDYDETPCPQCGHSPTYRCDCPNYACDDGWIDMHEYDDPMLFDEGEEEPCQECLGLGYLHWCPECGYNLNVDHRTMEMIDEAIAAEKLREALSEYAHEAWSNWMNYLLSQSVVNEDGTWTVPADSAERWYRQMTTPYFLLPESEKASDRAEADKMLTIMYPSQGQESSHD